MAKRQRNAIGQVKADIAIWEHQRYTEPPGLATAEAAGFREIRKWLVASTPPRGPSATAPPNRPQAPTNYRRNTRNENCTVATA